MFKFLVLHACHLMAVLLWENFTVLDRLNGSVIVILMHLSVYGGGDVLMSGRLDLFMLDSGYLSLIHTGIVMAGSSNELGDGRSSFLHIVCSSENIGQMCFVAGIQEN
jgi:hypothetical protein